MRRLRLCVGIVLVALVSACAATVVEPSRDAAEIGVAASDVLVAQAEATTRAYRAAGAYQALTLALKTGRYDPPGADDAAILTAYRAREAMYRRLRDAYGSYFALATADSRATVAPSIAGLVGAYGDLQDAGRSIGVELDDLPDAATVAATGGLAFLDRQQQGRALETANSVFAGILPGLIAFVEAEAPFSEDALRQAADFRPFYRRAMIDAGLADLRPQIAEMSALAGLDMSEDALVRAARDPDVVEAVLTWEAARDSAAVDGFAAQYDAMIGQLEGLLAMHRALAEDRPPDIAAVAVETARLGLAIEGFRRRFLTREETDR